jgi:hypothetical protein
MRPPSPRVCPRPRVCPAGPRAFHFCPRLCRPHGPTPPARLPCPLPPLHRTPPPPFPVVHYPAASTPCAPPHRYLLPRHRTHPSGPLVFPLFIFPSPIHHARVRAGPVRRQRTGFDAGGPLPLQPVNAIVFRGAAATIFYGRRHCRIPWAPQSPSRECRDTAVASPVDSVGAVVCPPLLRPLHLPVPPRQTATPAPSPSTVGCATLPYPHPTPAAVRRPSTQASAVHFVDGAGWPLRPRSSLLLGR